MKKFTLFILLLSPLLSFSQTINIQNFEVLVSANANYPSSTRFDYKFEVNGNYMAGPIAIRIYKNSISPANQIGYNNWRTDCDYDDQTYYSSYMDLETWFYSSKSFSTYPGQTFWVQVTFHGVTQTRSYTYENTGEPDINITSIVIEDSTTDIPHYYEGSNESLEVNCTNSGDGFGTISQISIFLSESSNFPNYSTVQIGHEYVNEILYPDETYSQQIWFDIPHFFGEGYIDSGYYYILTVLTPNEGSEDVMPRKVYIEATTKSAKISDASSSKSLNNETSIIYPNPSNGTLYAQLGNDPAYTNLKVYSSTGQQVYSENIEGKNKTKIELTNATPGIYFVELSNDTDKETIKVLIE